MGKQKLAVVTGASAGIGQVVAQTLAESGWQVLGIARREGTITHPAYRHQRLDLSDTAAVTAYFEGDFSAAFPGGGLERVGLVNNAGLLDPIALLPQLPMAQLVSAFTVNTVVPLWLTGFFLRTYAALPLRIVNVSSGAAGNPRAGWGVYCGTKAALQMAGRVFGEEAASGIAPYAGADFGLLTFEPGIVNTGMQTQIRGASAQDFPAVQRFIGMYEEGSLKDPALPAAEIRAYLEGDPDQAYREARLG